MSDTANRFLVNIGKIAAALLIFIGVATSSPAISEASPGKKLTRVTSSITSVDFTSKNSTGRGKLTGVVHLKHKHGTVKITDPSTVTFVKSKTMRNHAKTVVYMNSKTGKLITSNTTIYLNKRNFNASIGKHKRAFKQSPRIQK